MHLTALVYKELTTDDVEKKNWKKETIKYVENNRNAIYRSIRTIGRRYNKYISKYDEDDIYMELVNYLYANDDYNIEKAINVEQIRIVTLEGYINTCTAYVILRYISEKISYDSRFQSNEIEKDDDKVSIFDYIADGSNDDAYSKMEYELDKICKSYEYKRYAYGIDIYQLFFIRLKTQDNEVFQEILNVLGIQKSDISELNRLSYSDDIMISIAKAVTACGVKNSIKILRKYVFCADKIERAISTIQQEEDIAV